MEILLNYKDVKVNALFTCFLVKWSVFILHIIYATKLNNPLLAGPHDLWNLGHDILHRS